MRRAARGYTLIEILVAIAIVGILAMVAVMGIRSWIRWAKTGEGKDLVQMISYGQHAYYEDTGGYLNCSDSWTDWYPAAPDGKKRPFHDASHPSTNCWRMISPDADSPTYLGFTVRAGTNLEAPPAPPTTQVFGWPAPPYDKPWFIVLAAANSDGDADYAYWVGSSFMGSDIHLEAEDE